MHITVSDKPNALGSYRYDVSANGRRTFGFRPSAQDARKAAQEDGSLMYLAGREEEDAPETKLPKRLRRKES